MAPIPSFHSRPAQGFVIVIVAIGIIGFLGVSILQLIFVEGRASVIRSHQELAYQVAEAGLHYYKWHLAKNGADFEDCAPGEAPCSSPPYTHAYTNDAGNDIGAFSLTITPPEPGTSRALIESTGAVEGSDTTETVTSEMCIPTFADFQFVQNDDLTINTGITTTGRVHSNGNVVHNGTATGIVTSSSADLGVTTTPPTDPATVFLNDTIFPVAGPDFGNIYTDYNVLRSLAQDDGAYLGPSEAQGYIITFNGNGTYSVSRVITQQKCRYRLTDTDPWTAIEPSASPGITIQAGPVGEEGASSYPLPTNNIIFVEDDVWVKGILGQSGGVYDRALVVAAETEFDTGQANIFVNNSIAYSAIDGRNTLGLVAQNNVAMGYFSDNAMNFFAAAIAEKGFVGRYHYTAPEGAEFSPAGCDAYLTRSSLTYRGSIASFQQFTFGYEDGGYTDITYQYDPFLECNAPPYFPQIGPYALFTTTRKSSID